MRLDPRVPVAVATRNAAKLRELFALWGSELPALVAPGPEYPEVAETESFYEANALLKARALAASSGGPALADDSGIEVEALGWGPGVLSARSPSLESSWQERNAHIIAACDSFGDPARRARFVSVCALVVPGFEPVIARGEVEGSIALAPAGNAGFGYDPIFVYAPFGMTFAQAGD
ncbi:MAG TPA: non-canonical purine NTP pyrophosphatase, partial [Candidatus Eremiobacteraceae bacterium]